ncbi:MAG: hypothetical protein ABIW32_00125 [Terrimesophilobacter sp.]
MDQGDASGINRVLAYLSTSLEPIYGFLSLRQAARLIARRGRTLRDAEH